MICAVAANLLRVKEFGARDIIIQIRAWLGFASLHAFGIGGHRTCLPLRSGSRGIATLRLLPNGSGVSVVLMLVDTLWRGSETWAKGQVCPAPLSTWPGPLG